MSGSATIDAAVITTVPPVDIVALMPVVLPVAALVIVLLLDALLPRDRRMHRLLDAVALTGLLGAGLVAAALALGPDRATFCVPPSTGDGPAVVPSCSFVVSEFTLILQAVALLAAVGSLLLALDGPGAADRTPHHVLLLSAVTGAVALAGARDLATLVVALETATLPGVGLVALRRDAQGAQAGLTFLLTAIGSLGVLLLGVGMLALATGTLHLEGLAVALSAADLDPAVRTVAVVGVLLVIAGIGFKVSLVPFHLWTPDTYAGAPLPVAAFLSTVSKVAGVGALIVVLTLGLPPLADVWAPVIGVVALVTMTVGNLVALRQSVAVRLLAWSTVAQAGWVVLPLAAAGEGSPVPLRTAAGAALGYLLAYVVAGLAVFAVVVLVARHHPAGEEHTLEAYRGLARTEPVASAGLAFGLLCLAGLPPGVMGLLAKVVALRPLVDSGAWVFAVGAGLNVALGLAYYVRWAGLLAARGGPVPPRWRVTAAEGLALGGAVAGCVGLSVAGQAVAGLLPGTLL